MDYWLDGTNSGNDEDTTQGTGLGGNGLMDWGGPADALAPKPAREKTLGEWLYPDMKPTQGYGGPRDAGDGGGSGLAPTIQRRRVSAAGFDIDTGEYVGPDRYKPLGFNPDTGEPIMPGQAPAPGNEPEPLYIPEALKDKHPAARVLWAVQTGQLPYLKGLPAIDENGDMHPAYARAVGAGLTDDTNTPSIDGGPDLALNFPEEVIDNARSAAEQSGYDTSKLSDEEIDSCMSSMPKKDRDRIKGIYDRLPDEGEALNDQKKQDMLKTSRELRGEVRKQLESSPCRDKLNKKS